MKLWLRQTLLCLAVILLSFSACVYLFVAQQTHQQLDDALEGGAQNVRVFCEHLSTLEQANHTASNAEEPTRRALIQYTFATYAHLLQGPDCAYSLAADGAYLYNVSPYLPLQLLPLQADVLTASRIVQAEGVPLLVSAQNVTVLAIPVTVYAVQNLSDTFAHIDALARQAQLALASCLAISALLLPLTLRRTLRPLRILTHVSERIAGGQYALRSHIRTGDEVGDLSRAFDHMAETVAQKVRILEDTARRRELLLGALTHEMKTPMTAIIGFSDSLLTMPLTEEARMEAAHEIHEAALRTERLSQKMMQLIAMEDCTVLQRKRLPAAPLLEQARAMMAASLAERDITLTLRPQAPRLFGDADLLTCLVTNLIDNAAKASLPGSEIVLTASQDEACYALSVADRGIGIPADKLALVTEPFYRVDKARSRSMGGAGLGLSLCQMIAQAHGGTLHIESQEGTGTTITMRWPKEDDHE